MNSELRKVVLSIDTSQYDQLVVGLKRDSKEKTIEEDFDFHKSQGLLPLIEKILQQEKVQLAELSGIEVKTGPGSYTGLRVGVSIANTLGTVLQLPINGQPVGVLAEPIYQ